MNCIKLACIFSILFLLCSPFKNIQAQSLDTDGDGIPDQFDADDDGDGLLDRLDSDPAQASIDVPRTVMPWLNEIKVNLQDDSLVIDVINVELAKLSTTDCNLITVHAYDAQGLSLKRVGSASSGAVAGEVVGWYRGATGCDDVWLVNNYDFVNLQFFNGTDYDRFDLSDLAGFYLEYAGKCIDVISFGGKVSPANSDCKNATYSNLPGVLDKSEERTWARAGIGVRGEDFTHWYEDDRYWSISSGWKPYRNNFQSLQWSAPESLPMVDATEFGVLEIPKPRNSVVKSLQDSGWSYPPINGATLKVHQVSEILDAHLEDDDQSDYVFASDKIRPDFLEFMKFMLGTYTGFMGGVRAENYMHHFDYSSEVLNELAFQRGNYDAKSCYEENGGPEFFSVGSGGGYWGMAEESFLNDKLYFCYGSLASGSQEVVGVPRRNFDASYGNGYDWPDNVLSVGSEIDLGAQSEDKYGGTRTGKFRDGLMSGHMHEWSHNWEAFHTIVNAEFGPMRFSHPVAYWADSPLMHGTSIPFELYVREYVIDDQDYDGTEKIWSLKKSDEPIFLYHDFRLTDHLTKFRAGDQSVEHIWSAYLIKQFGLEKLYSEYYRRIASSGDTRIALHQTYGKPYDELLQDAAAWASTVRTHEDFRLLFDSADEFKANLNQSFNVSLLQARNASTPNNRYQTLYTYVGDGEPRDDGETWVPVAFTSGESLVFSENVVSDVTASESGQLQINGHKAYFYNADTSVFHAGGLAVSDEWSGFTRRGERTSDLWFPVFIYDHDSDGMPDDYDPDYQEIYFTEDGKYRWDRWPGAIDYKGFGAVVSVLKPSDDTDEDGVPNSADQFPLDSSETIDTDGDGLGNNADTDDDNDGFSDDQEELDGTNPLNRFSCRSGCFSFDIDENLEAQPLTDGLLVIRHLFGFSGDSLTSGAVSGDASRDGSDVIASYLTDADSQLDIDGDGESKPLTDGLLLIRYLFGFSGDSLISGAIGDGAERDTADEVEAYIEERVPVQ
ncbi:hypothetical protein N8291_08235 [Pseudomonadales bacterium]|nr:hypothetical protein [Pseudomonadales bacterium]